MTENKFSSPINLFTPGNKLSVPGSGMLGETDRNSPFDSSFSRELSRATDRAQPFQDSSSHSRRENTGSKETSRTQDPHCRTDGSDTVTSDQGVDKTSATRASADEDSTDKVPHSTDGPVEKKRMVDKDSVELPESQTQQGETNDAGHPALSQIANQPMPDEDEKTVLLDLDSLNVEQTTDAQLPAEPVNLDGLSETDKPDAIVSEDIVVSDQDAVDLEDSARLTITDIGPQTRQRLSTGEHLSPGELASRQTYLFNSATRQGADSATLRQLSASDDTADAASPDITMRTATSVSLPTGQLIPTLSDKKQKIDATVVRGYDGGEVKPALPSDVPTKDATVRDLQHANLESAAILAANAAANTAARKSGHPVIKSNLAQELQFFRRQAQSLEAASPATTPEPVNRLAQSPDNTFLSVQGGIVTAPSVPRTEAGSSQTVNAPINMPILQADADKAMAGNIRWMVNEGVKNAVVNVTPAGMGPISVSIGIEKDQMNVSIVALQGSTREALDSLLPRLRDQLATQGHDSVRVDISDGRTDQSERGYGQQFADGNNESEQDKLLAGDRISDEEPENDSVRQSANEVVDSQGFLNLNEMGQIRSRYDVYV
ncbi:MAG: flagellar hook-length control protein FliK [Granulosicoccus sp.]